MEILQSAIAFIFLISVIVFVHEFGHYIVARMCGVKIEEFSIGFGRKIYGYQDKNGTLWKICIIPMGGYVKMFGDKDATSMQSSELKNFSKKEESVTLHGKNVWQRIAIVAAGPVANYLFAIIIITIFYFSFGIMQSSRIIQDVEYNSPAYKAGLKGGDEIIKIGNHEVDDFKDIAEYLILHEGKPTELYFFRNGEEKKVSLTPIQVNIQDIAGKDAKIYRIGVMSSQPKNINLSLSSSFIKSLDQTYKITKMTLVAIKQMIVGERGTEGLGGPIKIAQYSSMSLKIGFNAYIWFMAMLSLNLGLVNLFPIPMLDGGHLFFYIIEVCIGRPVPKKIQEISFKIGLILLIMLFVFSVSNDLISLGF